MTPTIGNAAARTQFAAALTGRGLHHAWLLAGPEGVGKAHFARAAAIRMLAEAAGATALPDGLHVPAGDRSRMLVEAGSHPDFRRLARLPKDADKPDQDLARGITIAQIRALQPMFATAPSMGPRRVVLIDSIDDVERAGANALLKNLEEPPQGTIFLLVSHAPGRLLPTIRSRCRLLRFEALHDDEVATVLRAALPGVDESEIDALVAAGEGSPGHALRFAGLDLARIDAAIAAIAANGDPNHGERVQLAKSLTSKGSQPRYAAFLDRATAQIAHTARARSGPALKIALDTYAAATELAGAALGHSLDQQATVFEMAGLLARLAPDRQERGQRAT